jgi:hypothetical protein
LVQRKLPLRMFVMHASVLQFDTKDITELIYFGKKS